MLDTARLTDFVMNDRPPDGERIASIEAELPLLRQDLMELTETLRHVQQRLDQATGGLRMLLWLGGFGGLGGLLHLVAPWLSGAHPK
jgi:hypothetical protein